MSTFSIHSKDSNNLISRDGAPVMPQNLGRSWHSSRRYPRGLRLFLRLSDLGLSASSIQDPPSVTTARTAHSYCRSDLTDAAQLSARIKIVQSRSPSIVQYYHTCRPADGVGDTVTSRGYSLQDIIQTELRPTFLIKLINIAVDV